MIIAAPSVIGLGTRRKPSGGGGGGDYRTGLTFELLADNVAGGGSPIGTWTDSSGNGNDGVSVGSTDLFRVDSIFNGHAGVQWSSGDQRIEVASNSAGAETVFLLLQFSPSGTQVVTDCASGTYREIYFSGGVPHIYSGADIGGGTLDGSPHLLTAVFAGSSSAIYIDGSQVASGNAGTDGRTGFRIGRSRDMGFPFAGYIGAVRRYGGALASGDRATVEAFLQSVFF